MQVRSKKRQPCFWKLARQKYFYYILHCIFITFYYIFNCVPEYIPFVSKKDITNTQTQIKKQKKLTKKRDIQNKPKRKSKKKKCCCCEQYLKKTIRQNSLLTRFSTGEFVCRNRLFFSSNNKVQDSLFFNKDRCCQIRF